MSHYTGMREGEVFIGNTDEGIPAHIAHLPSVRLGDVALDIEGKKLADKYRPIFMSRADAVSYDRIMVARFEAVSRSRWEKAVRTPVSGQANEPQMSLIEYAIAAGDAIVERERALSRVAK